MRVENEEGDKSLANEQLMKSSKFFLCRKLKHSNLCFLSRGTMEEGLEVVKQEVRRLFCDNNLGNRQ